MFDSDSVSPNALLKEHVYGKSKEELEKLPEKIVWAGKYIPDVRGNYTTFRGPFFEALAIALKDWGINDFYVDLHPDSFKARLFKKLYHVQRTVYGVDLPENMIIGKRPKRDYSAPKPFHKKKKRRF